LLKTTGGKERLGAYIAQLTLSAAERKRLSDLLPAIHADKTRFYSSVVYDGAVPLRDGVSRLVEEALAAGCRLAIASTTTSVNVDALLQSTLGTRGRGMFSVIACGDQVRARKPSPAIYQRVLLRLGLSPHQAVAFEDSANGLRAAAAAGLWTVVTPTFWTEGSDFASAGLLLPRLGDPARPLEGEPGGQLQLAAWLTFEELLRRAQPQSPASSRFGLPHQA
jgi:beta-phosphoglucomutase-like phosphatase (HAD superfamily)